MKKYFFIVVASFICSFVKGQSINDYFRNKGILLLANYSHPSSEYKSGSYNARDSMNFVDVDIKYQDGNETLLRVYRSGIFFSKIDVINDSDIVPPFFAAAAIMNIVIKESKKDNQGDIQKTLKHMKTVSNTDPEHWDGKTWALFAINLDYYSSR